MKHLALALLLIAIKTVGQNQVKTLAYDTGKGIKFEEGLSWQQVQAKAKAEGKMIFLDCYTTWCGPCKKMDKEVYTDSNVGSFFNKHFINYKIQLDSTPADNAAVRAAYADARLIEKSHEVVAFPTMLFLSADGNVLKRQQGAVVVEDLIKIGQEAIDPSKNYYSLLEAYKKGTRDLEAMRVIASSALSVAKDTATATAVAKEYMAKYPKNRYLNKEHIEFLVLFTKTPQEPGFKFFYDNVGSINKLMGDKMYAQSFIRYIIFMDMVLPIINKHRQAGSEPDWKKIEGLVAQKYNAYYGDLVTLAIKTDWFQLHKQWDQYCTAVVKYVDRYVLNSGPTGHWPAFTLNNYAWDLFLYSSKPNELSRAAEWSAKALLMDPNANWMDTYANLQHKLGNTSLAIEWEKMAVQLAPDQQDFKDALRKMKEGKPSWPEKKQ